MSYYRVKETRDALGRVVMWESAPAYPNLIFVPRRGGQQQQSRAPKKKPVAKCGPEQCKILCFACAQVNPGEIG